MAGLFEFLGLGKAAGDAIATPVEAIGNVLDKLFTSDDERQAADLVLQKLAMRPGELQTEINKLEAQHRSVWVAGWRPGIGWVCALALFFYYVPQFILATVLWWKACWATGALEAYPADASSLLELVLALLGMATIRSVEKLGRVAK